MVPEITLIEMSPDTVTQFTDSIDIVLEYKDGDGDLGFPDADSLSLYVKDDRLPDADLYFIRPLAPLDANVAIQGIIEIKLKNTFLLGNGADEFTRFTIKIKDRAGHWSNEVYSQQLVIEE